MKPHSKYKHVFIIVRADYSRLNAAINDFCSDQLNIEDIQIMDYISVVKVMKSSEEAEEEAKRLNDLRSSKQNSRYYVSISRLIP